MAASGAPLPARGTQTPSPASREPASPARGLRALLQTSAPRPPRRPSPYLGGRHFRSRRHLQLLLGYPEEQQHGDPEHPEDRQRQAASQTPHGPVCLAFSPALRPWGTPWRSGSEGQESARAAAPGFRCRAGGKLLGRGPARFGEKEAGAGVSGRRAAGKDRRAAKLDTRSRRRSAVAAEMLPEPPPPPQPRPPPPPRGKRTGAAGREESEAVPGTPGGTQGRREERERRESVGPTERLRGSPGGSEQGSARGRYRRPPTEAHRAALGPPEPSPARSSRAGLGWGGAGQELRPRSPTTPAASWDLGADPRPAERGLGGLSRSPRGLHVALTPGARPQCTCLPRAGVGPWDRGTRALAELLPQPRFAVLGRSGPRPSSASSPGCFYACLQVPGNFFRLMERWNAEQV